jgi:hypothetical protein
MSVKYRSAHPFAIPIEEIPSRTTQTAQPIMGRFRIVTDFRSPGTC